MGRNREHKKKALILIKQGGDLLVINPSDLKLIEVARAESGNRVTIQTSVFKHSFNATDYMINDRIRPALRERYNLVTLNSRGVHSTAGYCNKNNIIIIEEGEGDRSKKTFIFPKAFKSLEVEGNKIRVSAFRKDFEVDLGRQVNRTELDYLPLARLENPPVEAQEEV